MTVLDLPVHTRDPAHLVQKFRCFHVLGLQVDVRQPEQAGFPVTQMLELNLDLNLRHVLENHDRPVKGSARQFYRDRLLQSLLQLVMG